jgi:gliding-associated putative ABC transporter substrate-binding component GldG
MHSKRSHPYKIYLLLITGILLYFISTQLSLKADLTDDQRYSLSPASKKLLSSLSEPVRVDILLTGDFPAVFKKLQNSTDGILREMKEYAGNSLQVQFLSIQDFIPEAEQEKEWIRFRDSIRSIGVPIDSLLAENPGMVKSFKQEYVADVLKRLGIMPYTLQVQQSEDASSQQVIYPAAIVSSGKKKTAIDLLSGKTESTRDPLTGRPTIDEARSIGNAEMLLEYKIISAIDRIQRKQKPSVAYLIGNGEPMGPETQNLVETISQDYQLGLIDLQKNKWIPAEIAALLIVKPNIPFSDSAKQKIDQFVMQGGKILWFIDQLYAEKDSLALNAKTVAYDRNLNLDDLLFRYGLRINRDLLQDRQCDLSKLVVGVAGGKPQLADVPFNYYPLLNASTGHPITRNLEPVLGQFCNTLDTVKAEGVKKTFLLHSSEAAKTLSTPAMISLDELKTIERPELYNKKNIPVAVLLEGRFQSLYTHRTTAAMQDSIKAFYDSFRTAGPDNGCMLVAGDGDLVLNDFTRNTPLPMGYSRSNEMAYANKQFLENSLQYMTGLKDIVALRNREIRVRLLDKVKLEKEKLKWQLINILAPLLLLIAGGFAFTTWRKRFYERA